MPISERVHRAQDEVKEVCFARCPVPTATGIAADLGTLDDEFAVRESLLDERPDIVVSFLTILLGAAEWAASHPKDLAKVLAAETGSALDGVSAAYRNDYHRRVHPDLTAVRLGPLAEQKDFLLANGLLAGDGDIATWAAPEQLEAAQSALRCAER